jgi:transcriptional regulator with XRE-family HTH domain
MKSRISLLISERLRRLRRERQMRMSEVARKAGLPVSSYGCIEGGYYAVTIDNLFRILGALEADITEVWPSDDAGSKALESALYVRRLQEFRFGELLSLSRAEGAALFLIDKDKRVSVLMAQTLSDFLLDRLAVYLEDGREYDQGVWIRLCSGGQTLALFLKATSCPEFVRRMAEQYLPVWFVAFCLEGSN